MRNKLPTTENDVKSRIKDWFTNLGGWSVAIPAGRGMGTHGIVDRLGVIPVRVTPEMVGKQIGLFVAIEAKKPGRRGEANAGATQAQVDFLMQVLNHSGLGALVDSDVDLANLGGDIAFFMNSPEEREAGYKRRFLNRLNHHG